MFSVGFLLTLHLRKWYHINMGKKQKKECEKLPIERIEAPSEIGLSNQQVQERIEKGYVNTQPKTASKSYFNIFRTNFFTLFNLLNVVLFILILVFGEIKNALFMGVVLVNIVIGTIQEIRSKKTVEKLSLLSAPKVHVMREGEECEIRMENLVLDDILSLRSGNQVTADSIVVDGECEVNESLLTGEQDAVFKKKGDKLFSGSFISTGSCKARVESVGADNYASRIVADARRYKKPNSELMRSIKWIIRVVGIFIVPVGILVFLRNEGDVSASVTSAVASMIGMIPEGLVLLTSVALAVGVIKLARKRTLVQELYCIETLARVDTLCLDKTGTITEGTMQVEEIVPLCERSDLGDIMYSLVSATDDSNPTFDALRSYFKDGTLFAAEKVIPFSSQRKWSASTLSEKGSFILGAPEFVMKQRYSEIENTVNDFAQKGFRVLVLVKAVSLEETDEKKFEKIALIVLSDKIRGNAKETLGFFAEQGVELKVISGDNPLTVSKVAERAGLKGFDKYIDASTLDTDEKLFDACDKYTIFGRVTPAQKKSLVAALKKKGHVVGMTGDGVNDVMALKESDCSIAMATGSDAARHASQLVLLDSDFSALPQVVAEGRRVINNIARASSLFLVKTTYSFFLSLITIIAGWGYPFEPIQLTLISSVLVGAPAFFLALEPNNARISGKFIKKVINKALPAGITISILVSIALAVCQADGTMGNSLQTSSLCVFIAGIVACIVLVETCWPFNKIRSAVMTVFIVLFIGCIVVNPYLPKIPFGDNLFSITYLTNQNLIYLAALGLSAYPMMLAVKFAIFWMGKAIEKISPPIRQKAEAFKAKHTSLFRYSQKEKQ